MKTTSLRVLSWACAGFAALSACADSGTPRATQILARIDADPALRAASSSLYVRSARTVQGAWQPGSELSVALDAGRAWPIDIPVTPRRDGGKSGLLQLIVQLRNSDGAALAEARALTQFVAGEARVLEVLVEACGELGPDAVCESDSDCYGTSCLTCSAGACVETPVRDGSELPVLDASVTPVGRDAGGELDAGDADVDAADAQEADEGETDADLITLVPDAEVPCIQARCMENAVQACTDGSWAAPIKCVSQACVDAACVGTCEPGQHRCTGLYDATVELCAADGTWGVDTSKGTNGVCAFACEAGACVDTCSTEGTFRCSAQRPANPIACRNGKWEEGATCGEMCRMGAGCVSAPSCVGTVTCGANESCCNAPLVPGGTFYRSYDGNEYPDMNYPATVSPFHLDRFEVTVGRIRRWLGVLDIGEGRPNRGSGRSLDPDDVGWRDEWSAYLPTSGAALAQTIMRCEGYTYSANGQNDKLPANCLGWFAAQAFCIWDGGRLPTEAEWNFAASGGEEHRLYPWVALGVAPLIDHSYAAYADEKVQEVGHFPTGDGRWRHADLVGNLEEYMLDEFSENFGGNSCFDCVVIVGDGSTVLRGGAAIRAARYANSQIHYDSGRVPNDAEGFRCVR